MKLVMAEKPSVGKEYAKILGASKSCDGYMEGNDWVVTWGFGHLVELEDPDYYLDEALRGVWRKEQLPFLPLPDDFVFRIKTKKDEKTHKRVTDDGAKKQLNTIKNLFKRSDVEYLVNGTDAGREGEAIFRYVYNFLGVKKPVKRLWTSSLTDTALRQAFGDLKDSKDYDNLFTAALCRNEADWLVGMNATRALTIVAGSANDPLSIGRVQTPTMVMICERYEQFVNFKPVPYYVIKLEFTSGNGDKFTVVLPEKFDDREKAEEYINGLPQKWSVISKEEKEVKEKAPLPFCIDDVQIKANQLYGMKAQQTLDCVQSLYEAKMVTYPRTGSRYLGEDMVDMVGAGIGKLAVLDYSDKFIDACKSINATNVNKAMFDSSKLTDHHAIIPTFENFKTKTEEFDSIAKGSVTADDLKRVYDLIVKQLVMASMPVCIKNKLTYKLSGDGVEVSVSGFTIKNEGWRSILGKDITDEEKDKEDDNQKLPNLTEGDSVDITNKNVENKQTTPEPILTEATLLKLMEGAGKLIDDDEKELKKAIKDCGIGTPATRAAAIETLYRRGYVRSEGKKLIPTDKGLDFYHVVKNEDVAKVEMTAEWEQKLQMVEEGKYPDSDFMTEITEYTKDLVDSLLQVNGDAIRKNEAVSVGECPLCGGKVIETDKFYKCVNRKKDDPDSCRFFINKTFSPYKGCEHLVKFKKKDLQSLLKLKETSEYQVEIKLDVVVPKKFIYSVEEKKVQYKPVKRDATSITCPKCGGKIIETDKQFKCENNNYLQEGSCPICLFKDTKMGVTLDERIVNTLLSGGKEKVKLTSKSGKKYDGILYYDFDKNRVSRFNEERETGLVCPKCGGKIIETDFSFRCENNNYGDESSCPISIFKEQGIKITAELVKTLLDGNQTDNFTFKGQFGEYQAALKFDFESNKVVKIFPPKEKKERNIKDTGLACKCGGKIQLVDDKFYTCSNHNYKDPKSCQFSAAKVMASKEITVEILKELLEKGEIELDGFKSKAGKDFSARIGLKINKIEFLFDKN